MGQHFHSKVSNLNYGAYMKTNMKILRNEMQILNKILILLKNSVHGIWNHACGFPRVLFSLSSPITVVALIGKKGTGYDTDNGDIGE